MKKLTSFAFCCSLAATLVACNFPATPGASPVVVADATPTASFPTHVPSAEITLRVPTPQPPSAPTALGSTRVPTAVAQTPGQPSASRTPAPNCDRASPGNPFDISVPDSSTFQPGETFTKTWRILNSGTCTWTTDYAAVWFSGETFGAPVSTNLSNPVAPGKSVDVSVDMVAPAQPGTYQSNWKISDASGNLFGIGPTGDAPFWVRIDVVPAQVSEEQLVPTQPTPAPVVYASGIANLTFNDGLNLDQIQINQGKGDDLLYQQNANLHQLVPENGALLVQVGKGQPSIDDCRTASLGTDPQNLDEISSGTYFCYKTNLGLPGWVRLVYLNPQDHVLTIEILTWSTP